MIDWNKAPKGAVAIKQDDGAILVWTNDKDDYFDTDRGKWIPTSNGDWVQVIATHPNTRKTVKDAVEWFDNEWASICSHLYWNEDLSFYEFHKNPCNYHVCTRAEFEAYVAEQEGEKWTHEFNNAAPRQLKIISDIPDCNGEIAIMIDGLYGKQYSKASPSSIRPIKPKLTAAQIEAVEKFAEILLSKDTYHIESELAWFKDNHEVTDD